MLTRQRRSPFEDIFAGSDTPEWCSDVLFNALNLRPLVPIPRGFTATANNVCANICEYVASA
jgi:hypothetical protein